MTLDKGITNKKSIETFSGMEKRFLLLYNEKFSYDKSIYKGYTKPIVITCKLHGDFEQSPANHIKGLPHNCPKCVSEASIKRQSGNKEDFVSRANNQHNYIYTYENFVYVTARIPSFITCKIHGDFKQSADNHVRGGNGCPHCGSRLIKDKSKNQACTLYIIRVQDNVYKVGITTKSIEERMRTEKRIKYTKLLSYDFCSTVEAHKLEQVILSRLRDYKYIGAKLMTSGNTELLTVNPLKVILRKIKRGLQAKQRYTKRIKNEY